MHFYQLFCSTIFISLTANIFEKILLFDFSDLLCNKIDFAMIVNVILYCGKNCTNSFHINSLLSDTTEDSFEFDSTSTFDDVFLKCAKECGITPPYISLFGLRDHKLNWVNLSCQLDDYLEQQAFYNDSSNLKLEYRIRFAFNSEGEIGEKRYQAYRLSLHDDSKKPVMNEKVTKYMFHQQHSDFINGYLTLKETLTDDLGAALGVAVLDLLRLACEMKCRLKTALRRLENYKKLLPAAIQKRLQSMNFLNRLRVNLKFRHYLRHFAPNCNRWMNCDHESSANPSFFYSRYLRNLELVVNRNHVETYTSVCVVGSPDITKVSVGGDCGLVLSEGTAEKCWCDFPEITDMRILQSKKENEQIVYSVSISQLSGEVIDLDFKSSTEAENFATCINGYYMLVTDPHHYLNKNITAPSLVKQLSLNCHGPIPCADAEKFLKNQLHAREGDCLLRQSQESFDEYFINTVIEASNSLVAVRNYKIDKNSNDKLGIFGDDDSYKYDDITSLLKACRASSEQQHNMTLVPFNLNHLAIPTKKSASTLKIYRCSDAHFHEVLQNKESNEPTIRQIPQNIYAFQKVLGTGKYTTVISWYLTKDPNHKVAVKKVYDPHEAYELAVKQHVQESFHEAVCLQNLLKNDYIVELKGTMKNMMVLDYAPHGSITEYLQNTFKPDAPYFHNQEIRYGWFLQILWQLTHACNYLEQKGIAHGNIKGKNVLLWQADPEPFIKLSDPGVRTHCVTILGKNKEYTNVIEPLLQVPWLAREFCWIDGKPDSMSYVTIDGDKWSFATTVYEICWFGKLPDIQPCSSMTVSGNMLNHYLTGGDIIKAPEILSSSDALRKTIKQCWSLSPQKRPPYKNILRELGTILASDDIHSTVRPTSPIQPPPETTSIPDLQRFEDRYLVQLQNIGQGHFGRVDLYRYDAPDQDVRLQVAVKSFHHIKNTPGQDREFNHEIETMRRLNHKHIVKLMGVAEPSLRIVMEYLQDGSLSRYLSNQKRNGKPFSEIENDLLSFSRQIAEGMIALQEQRLIHRDLALRNILLAREPDDPNSPLYVKISDFGLSRILREDDLYYRQNPNEIPAQWYAPECLNDHKISFRFESDIWSYGVTVWEMFSYGRPPKYDLPTFSPSALYKLLSKGKRLSKPMECSTAVYDQILKCWEFQPQDRPTFKELRQNFDAIIK